MGVLGDAVQAIGRSVNYTEVVLYFVQSPDVGMPHESNSWSSRAAFTRTLRVVVVVCEVCSISFFYKSASNGWERQMPNVMW